ncbi:hypothetical protein [Roseicella frigidaeris]|uniref:hypothetical protein n=1 Tax=Roseicella frigidaeris TaxID=2230885 RepID=UPI0014024115|nr:hypothetical protein [Roseicella frigidaeris]
MKKIGGIVLLIAGLVALMLGFNRGPTWLVLLGIVFVIGGIVLLAVKIARRNQGNLP